MFAMTGRPEVKKLRRCGSLTRRIEKGEHPARHLQGYTGIVQADGYAGLKKFYETERIVGPVGPVRRKFLDLYQAHRSPIAKEALEPPCL